MRHRTAAAALSLLAATCQAMVSTGAECGFSGFMDAKDLQQQQQQQPVTCQDLCKRASGMDCVSGESESWEEAGEAFCSIKFPSPSSQTYAFSGRISYVGVYTVPKDILNSLVTRFNQVKVIRALGGHVGVASGPVWPPPELGFFISLCFPRVSLAWEWLNGRRLAPASSCCNLECHWEEMLKAPKLPSLEQLLAKAVTTADELSLGSSAQCSSLRHNGQGYSASDLSQARSCANPGSATATPTLNSDVKAGLNNAGAEGNAAAGAFGGWAAPTVAHAARSMQGMGWWRAHDDWFSMTSVGQWLLWLLAPNLLVAREVLGLAAVSPWLSLYLCNAAVLLAGVEWVSMAAPCLHPATPPARALLAATHFLYTFVVVAAMLVVVTLLGAVGAWMPALQPTASALAWAALLAMPLLSGLFVLVVLLKHVRVELLDALEAISRVPQLVGAVPPHARAPWAPLDNDNNANNSSDGAQMSANGAGDTRSGGGLSSREELVGEGGRPGESRRSEGLVTPTLEGGVEGERGGSDGAGATRRLGTLPQLSQRSRLQHLLRQQQQQRAVLGQQEGAMDVLDRQLPQQLEVASWGESGGEGSSAWQELGPLGMVTNYMSRMRAITGGLRQLGSIAAHTSDSPNQPASQGSPGRSIFSTRHHSAASVAGTTGRDGITGSGGVLLRGVARGGEGGGVASMQEGGTTNTGGRSGSASSAAARQSAAAAALAAIHWPPPLMIPPWLEERHAVPSAFKCPITLSMMREPAQASSGVTYEKSAIFQWLSVHRVDPVTQAPLKRHRLTPNLNLRNMVDDWIASCEAEYQASNGSAVARADTHAMQSSGASKATSSTSSAAEEDDGCANASQGQQQQQQQSTEQRQRLSQQQEQGQEDGQQHQQQQQPL